MFIHGIVSDIYISKLYKKFFVILLFTETDSLDVVSGLQFVNANTFAICATNGTLYIGDSRDPMINHYALQESATGSHWAFGLKTDEPQLDPASCAVARLSSSGQVMVSDLRNPSTLIGQVQLNLQRNDPSDEFLTVTWAPALENHLAVSGISFFSVFISKLMYLFRETN